MDDFPSVCALTYVSVSFVSASRVHPAALALVAKARPAKVIVQNLMVNLDFSLLIGAWLRAHIVCRFPARGGKREARVSNVPFRNLDQRFRPPARAGGFVQFANKVLIALP